MNTSEAVKPDHKSAKMLAWPVILPLAVNANPNVFMAPTEIPVTTL